MVIEDTLKERLKLASSTSIPLFSLKGVVTYAKLVSNYDGDTGDIVLIHNNDLMHFKARFIGYDCCEMKPALSDPQRDDKKHRALKAKQRLWQLCTGMDTCENKQHNTLIKIKCQEFDKYGRLLVLAFQYSYDMGEKDDDILFKESINAQMISEGHAYKYDGGTKQDF